MITLRHTYNLNVSTFSKGVVRFKQNNNDRSRASDCLQTDDLVSLAEMSFSIFKWYDSGLLFLREAIDNLKSHSTNKEYKPPPNVAIMLDGLKSRYVDLHNSLLLNKNTHIGPDWRLFPFFVNKGFFHPDNNIQMPLLDNVSYIDEEGGTCYFLFNYIIIWFVFIKTTFECW